MPSAAPRRSLSLFDSTSIVVGIIIGATIYQSAPLIASQVPNLGALVAVWLLGGLIALLGALCYAELATAFPESGGSYVYLTRAFGPRIGFLFAWGELWVVRPGSIGAMAFVFARYANELLPLSNVLIVGYPPLAHLIYAAGSVIALTLINLWGVQEGKWTQAALTTVKVVGLLAIVGVAFSQPSQLGVAADLPADWTPNYQFAIILIMFAYGGWNEVAFVAAEVRDPRRNLPRTLLLGLAIVTAIYILVNVAFAYALGWQDFRAAKAVAVDVVGLQFGMNLSPVISALVCVSTLAAINGLIFAGGRIYYAFGVDHPRYLGLGSWNTARGTPARSLVVQGIVCLIPLVAFGAVDGFQRLVIFTTPVFWLFFLLVGVSVMILRRRRVAIGDSGSGVREGAGDGDAGVRDQGSGVREARGDAQAISAQPFKVPFYPMVPLLFCASSIFMLYASFDHAWQQQSPEAYWAVVIMALGAVISIWERRG